MPRGRKRKPKTTQRGRDAVEPRLQCPDAILPDGRLNQPAARERGEP